MNNNIRRSFSFLFGIFLFLMALFSNGKSYAQFTANDTAYLNNLFTELPYISYWNKPGKWFTNNEITSVQDYFNQMDSNFKFYNHEYGGCFNHIIIESEIILDTQINITFNTFEQVNNLTIYGIPNPFGKVKFSLNNKSAYTYFVLDSTTNINQDCTVAYMVVLGSGQNAMSTFVQGTGYHNLYCQVRNNLKQYGDVYSMSRANEDHRAIFFNKKKLGTITPVQPTFMQSYLNAANRSYGANQLIETVAMIKFLKSKYDKVFVLGLSTGGKVALWSSMEAEPHAALISSGYTILADINYQTQLINSYSFGNFLLDIDKDSTKKRISELKTQFMFTWGDNDNYLAQLEVDSNLTQNYFQGLNNASYFYNYNSHTFPPCYAIDSFFLRSNNKSTCKLDYNKTICNKDSVILYAQFCGSPPYSFNLVRDSLIVSNHISNSNNDTFVVFESGNYEIRNVLDANNVQGFSSDRLNVLKSPQVSGGINFKNYICDSSLTMYDLISTGQSPWVWHFLKDNVQDSLLISNDSIHVNLSNGDYVFTTIIDSNNCIFNLLDTFSINNSNLSVTLTAPIYNCDSNKTHLQVNMTGNGPWMLVYTYNGINQQYTTAQNQSDLYLPNGTYQFISVQDATGCNAMINAVYTFTYQTLQASMSIPMYNCDSNKTEIEYSLQGNSPFTLQYTQDSQAQQALYASSNPTAYYSNGQYDFQTITDATGCIDTLNQNYTWNYDTISATLTAPMYNCDSNKTHLQLNLTGNGPWMLAYTYNGINQQYTTAQNQSDLYLPNGTYQFISVQDATGCSAMINAVYTFSYQALQASMSIPMYNCDSNKTEIEYSLQGNSPFTLQYTQDSQAQQALYASTNPTAYYDNGQYNFQTITDATGCVTTLNQNYTWNYDTISATLTAPMYNCDSNKTHLQMNLTGNGPWIVGYLNTITGLPYTVSSIQNIKDIYFSNGIYQVTNVTDQTQCQSVINQIITNLYSPLTFQKLNESFNCDSNKIKIDYQFGGDSPWTILIKDLITGITNSYVYNQNNVSLYFETGHYSVVSVSDIKCGMPINDTFLINFPSIQATLSPFYVNCDSGKYETNIQINSGLKPFKLKYSKDNLTTEYNTSSFNSTLILPNSIYYFDYISDSTGCKFPLNISFQADYIPFKYNSLTSTYNCAKDSTAIDFDLNGKDSISLVYNKNGLQLDTLLIQNLTNWITTNGDYILNYMYDKEGCVDTLNINLSVNNQKNTMLIDRILTNCGSKIYELDFIASGASPWTLYYNNLNNLDSILINSSISTQLFSNGIFNFLEAKDLNGCKYRLDSVVVLQPFLNFTPFLQTNFIELFVQQSNNRYNWFQNNNIIDTISMHSIKVKGDGEYYVAIIDSAGCTSESNKLNIEFPELISLYPNPALKATSLLVDADFDDFWSYSILNMTGKLIEKQVVHQKHKLLDISNLATGSYNIVVEFNRNKKKEKQILRLIKE